MPCSDCSFCVFEKAKRNFLERAKGFDRKSAELVFACLDKAQAFEDELNHEQVLRYADIALTKLKPLKDHLKDMPLEAIDIISDALRMKYNALNLVVDRKKEALECATERYNMWATTFMRNVGMILASIPLIEGLISNEEFDKAHLIASTVYEMATQPETNDIPDDEQQPLLANAAHYLALATLRLAQSGGIPPEENQRAGKETIMLARKSVELQTQLHGADSVEVAHDMGTLSNALEYFNGVDDDDDEALRLTKKTIDIYRRKQGSLTPNVALGEEILGKAYKRRASRAGEDPAGQDKMLANLELALPHYLESVRVYRAINQVDKADVLAKEVDAIKVLLAKPFFNELGLFRLVVTFWQHVPAHLFNPPFERPHTLAVVLAIACVVQLTMPYFMALLALLLPI